MRFETKDLIRFFIRTAGRDVKLRILTQYHDCASKGSSVVDNGFPIAEDVFECVHINKD
jgi:hypothetical protein